MVAFSKLLPPSARPSREEYESPRMRLVPSDAGDDRHDGHDDGRPHTLGRIDGGRSDRRIFPRQPVSLHVTGRRLDHSAEARREPCLHLSMKDVSVGGLCATSQTPVKVGEHVAVFFPPEGFSRGWDAYGRVLRVQPDALGYKIAVSFDRLPAA